MRLFLTVVLVGALTGCADFGPALDAGIDQAAKQLPEAIEALANEPGPSGLIRAAVTLIIAVGSGVAGYFAVKRYKKA